MPVRTSQTVDPRAEQARPASSADLIDRLAHYDGPPQEFLANLLAVQCRLAQADAGAILRMESEGKVAVAAVVPAVREGQPMPAWLARAAELAPRALAAPGSTIQPHHGPADLYGQPAERHLVLIPLRDTRKSARGLAAFLIRSSDPSALSAARERLELSASLLNLYEMRLTLQQRQSSVARLRMAMEVVSAVNESERFAGVAMAACNEIADRWRCERVSLGFLRGRYVHVRALSHTEKFSRKMKLAQDTESAMEECLDQDVEILYPAPDEATYVCRATKELSQRHGPSSVVSIPLRKAGEPVGVITAERPLDEPFTLEEIEALRLTCDLITGRVETLHRTDRWVGARAAAGLRRGAAALVGPRHTWAKLTAIAVCAAIAFLIFAHGPYRVDGMFVLEPAREEFVSAPFAGVLHSVSVDKGDTVRAGQELGRLNTDRLQAQLDAAQVEKTRDLMEASVAAGEGKHAEADIARKKAQEVQKGKIEPLTRQIEAAVLTAPFDGTVVSESLRRQVNREVEKGEPLFELAKLDTLRAEITVPEDQIAEVRERQTGELSPASAPDRRIPFVIERIDPVAEVVEQQNVFRVRARLTKPAEDWMKAGMEGVAKIDIDRRRYAWIWTRRLVNWLRMKLWM